MSLDILRPCFGPDDIGALEIEQRDGVQGLATVWAVLEAGLTTTAQSTWREALRRRWQQPWSGQCCCDGFVTLEEALREHKATLGGWYVDVNTSLTWHRPTKTLQFILF